MCSQILCLFLFFVLFFGLLFFVLLHFLFFRLRLVGDLLVELADFLNTLGNLVRSQCRVCSKAGLCLSFELFVEPHSKFLDFVAQILTLFASDPRFFLQDSR